MPLEPPRAGTRASTRPCLLVSFFMVCLSNVPSAPVRLGPAPAGLGSVLEEPFRARPVERADDVCDASARAAVAIDQRRGIAADLELALDRVADGCRVPGAIDDVRAAVAPHLSVADVDDPHP